MAPVPARQIFISTSSISVGHLVASSSAAYALTAHPALTRLLPARPSAYSSTSLVGIVTAIVLDLVRRKTRRRADAAQSMANPSATGGLMV